MATEFKIGQRVRGTNDNNPTLFQRGRPLRKAFEGIVEAVEPRETSDVDEELVTVRFTVPDAWSTLHGEKSATFYASELTPA